MLVEVKTVKLAPGVLVKENWNEPFNNFSGPARSIGVPATANCTSKAPMSLPSPPLALGMLEESIGRKKPHWSMLAARDGMASRLPLSIAGLPGGSAWVKVGPP